MRFTFGWLKRFLDTQLSVWDIVDGLNSLGLEVEQVIDRSVDLKDFKIAKILHAEPCPDASRLKICQVDDGKQILQIVCGASNARAGINVVLAPIGSIIPANKTPILLSTIRGTQSQGMLCSADELLLKGGLDGIIEIPDDATLGASLLEYYQLDDPVIEISITPNRGDCLGVYGIARDLSSKNLGILKELVTPEVASSFSSEIPVIIMDSKICSLFVGRHIKDVQNKQSPLWLANLLKNSGLKSISAIVDITNYICHSFAQPMHAFDASNLDKVCIRKALEGEEFVALNDKTYLLNASDVIVEGGSKPQALGGIIGGKDMATTPQTKDVYLEAAFFDKDSIIASARRHSIITDSKMRFERHVDDHFRLDALKIASHMISEICGGKFSDIKVIGSKSQLCKIEFDYFSFEDKIGLHLQSQQIDKILQQLGFILRGKSSSSVTILVPSWRDSKLPEDIIEEIIRVYGYEHIPEIRMPDRVSVNTLPPDYKISQKLRSMAAALGYFQAITYSFMSEKDAELFAPIIDELRVVNPISSQLSYMRSSIIPNLLRAAEQNQNISQKDIKLFEIGPIFQGVNPQHELLCFSAIASGKAHAISPHASARNFDAFDLKGDLENILHEFNITFDDVELLDVGKVYYHPHISARISYQKKDIGFFGAIHPKVLAFYGIEQEVFAFEIYVDSLDIKVPKSTFSCNQHQIIQRDFAFIVDKSQPAGEIASRLKKLDESISDVRIFDVYQGKNIAEGKKSIAFSVMIEPNRNLLSEEIEHISQKIIHFVTQNFFAQLRS